MASSALNVDEDIVLTPWARTGPAARGLDPARSLPGMYEHHRGCAICGCELVTTTRRRTDGRHHGLPRCRGFLPGSRLWPLGRPGSSQGPWTRCRGDDQMGLPQRAGKRQHSQRNLPPYQRHRPLSLETKWQLSADQWGSGTPGSATVLGRSQGPGRRLPRRARPDSEPG